jgi:glutathione S-transferase
MARLQLHGTPLSHFTRKVRILLAELGVDYEQVWVPGVLAATPATFANNPLMRVPALVDGPITLFESDHIARYLVGKYDASDWFGVRSDETDALNRLAVANGIMSNEVVLILAKRGGLDDIDGVVYFRKLLAAIEAGLAWLDTNIAMQAPMAYADIALVCMWQHVQHYKLVSDVERFTRIAARVQQFADRPSIVATAPETSLAKAREAGWKPS